MGSFLKTARSIHDVESDLKYVEIQYTKYEPDEKQYVTMVDYLQTEPAGDWVEIASKRQSIPYEKFLDTMLEQTTEVLRRKCGVALTNCLFDASFETEFRLMHCLKILDPSFVPPKINPHATWQRELVSFIATDTLHDVIEGARNHQRLARFFSVVSLINTEQWQ